MESINLLEDSSDILKNLSQISEKERNRMIGLININKAHHIGGYLGEIMKGIEILKDSVDILEKWGSQVDLAWVYNQYGLAHSIIGENKKALHFLSKSQKICESNESPHYTYPKLLNLNVICDIYERKGELQLALETAKHAVSLARKYNNTGFTVLGLHTLGGLYKELGEWDHALKSLKEALLLAKTRNSARSVILMGSFIDVYINMGDIPAAQQIFHQIEQYRDNDKNNNRIYQTYRFYQAVLMKMSKRTRDLGIAQDLFKSSTIGDLYYERATLHLCEMLLDEFKDTKNVEVLDEFSPLLKHLKEVAEKQLSYPLLAKTYLLDAKLSMIHFDMKKARQSLTKAQQIAEKYGLGLLAIKISNEHDKLLQNLEVWEQMKKENVPISERLEKVDFDDQLSTMLKKKPSEIPESSPESPILLLIMDNSGIPLYTKIFNKEWKIREELFSGFLSAFNSFSDEIFSEGLDRANFGKFTILMAGMPPFMSCYVFEGQSYLAHQKFSKFNESINDSEQIWKKLTFSKRTGQIIQDNSSAGLGKLVKTIF